MEKRWRVAHDVLVTAASRRVALVNGLRDALARHAPGSRVIAADISPWSPAVHMADAARRVPRSDDQGYVDALLDICQAEGVGLLVPTIDDELEVIARARPAFEALGVHVAVSSVETVRLCRDKALTSAHLALHAIPAATTWTPETFAADTVALPVFIKPRRGRGSVGAYAARTPDEVRFFLQYVSDPIVQTYLQAPEYTIDVFCAVDGTPIAVVPRERQVIRAGVTDRGRTVRDARLIELGLDCAAAFAFRGAINVQCRMVDGQPVVFEINPRFSGGIQLTMAAGANFTDWLVREMMGERLTPCIGTFTDGLYMTSYESSLFFSERPDSVLVSPRERLAASAAPRGASS